MLLIKNILKGNFGIIFLSNLQNIYNIYLSISKKRKIKNPFFK
jgi:hypothetical protein